MKHFILKDKESELHQICKELKIKRMYAFGSAVSDNFTEKSDIDFLISFIENISVEDYTNNYFLLHYKLRDLFKREIDILTERMLSNPSLIESIEGNKVLLYEA